MSSSDHDSFMTRIAKLVGGISYHKVPRISWRIVREHETPFYGTTNTPEAVAAFCREAIQDDGTEHLAALLLDTKNNILAIQNITNGTIDRCPAFVREIARAALFCNAKGVILVHNHPSGDVSPSKDDSALTKDARKALKVLGIELLDHVVFSHINTKCCSVREKEPAEWLQSL